MGNLTQCEIDPKEELPLSERADMHIFYVEGHPISRRVFTKMMERHGFQVTAVESPEENLKLVMAAMEGARPKPDMILIATNQHTNASAIDAFEGTRILKQEAPFKDYCSQLPIVGILNTGQESEQQMLERCLAVGMDDKFFKPLRPRSLERDLVRLAKFRQAVVEEPEECEQEEAKADGNDSGMAEGQEAASEDRKSLVQGGVRARL